MPATHPAPDSARRQSAVPYDENDEKMIRGYGRGVHDVDGEPEPLDSVHGADRATLSSPRKGRGSSYRRFFGDSA